MANFLRYVDAGFYEGGRFHRTVTLDNQPNNDVLIEVIQAGINPDRGGEGFDPIPLERTSVTVLRHEEGAISMARGGPDTARSPSYSSGSILPGATVVAAPKKSSVPYKMRTFVTSSPSPELRLRLRSEQRPSAFTRCWFGSYTTHHKV